MANSRTSVLHPRGVFFIMLVVGGLAACSGNLTGGATPPVQSVAAGGSVPGAVVPQGAAAKVESASTATPIPGASAEVDISVSPTPLVLPSIAGYGGTIVIAAATPLPSESPSLGLALKPAPQDAPLRDGKPKNGAVLPVVDLEIRSESGDEHLVGGLGGVSFSLPTASVKAAKHFALGLYETNVPPAPHGLFHRRKLASNSLLAMDEKTKIDKSGHTVSAVTAPFTLTANHQYSLVLYADELAPLPTPSPLPSSAASTVAPPPPPPPLPLPVGTASVSSPVSSPLPVSSP